MSVLKDRLVFLEIATGEIFSSDDQGLDKRRVLQGPKAMPDGIEVDSERGHIYFTCMGSIRPLKDDGSIYRVDFDGSNLVQIVPPGWTHTPKQCTLDLDGGLIYWCDREGMRVMRCALDGSNIEILVDNRPKDDGSLNPRHWCVGVAIDKRRKLLYWTQKGPSKGWDGRICRANLEIPLGESAENRTDIETLFAGLPEPIDLALHHLEQTLFWTDRGEPPIGNSVNRASVAAPLTPDSVPQRPHKQFVIASELNESIGIHLDLVRDRLFAADLEGGIYSFDLIGGNKKVLFKDAGKITGITYVTV